jgi:integrase
VEAVKRHAKSSPIAANRALAYASAFFSWCVSEDIVASNPAAGIKKPAKENSRDRHHTVDELAEIWEAAGTLGYPFGHIYRLLMALPMRREEIAALPVAELDLGSDNDPSSSVWTLPASRTKNGQALRVPLSPLARSIIEEALHDPLRPVTGTDEVGKEHPNPFLFSMTGLTPASGFGRAKRRLDAAIAAASAKKAEEASGAGGHAALDDPRSAHELHNAGVPVA